MTTKTTQYRVTFTNIAVFGNEKASTKWYSSIEECAMYLDKQDAELVTRELVKDTEAFKKARNAKFNNQAERNIKTNVFGN